MRILGISAYAPDSSAALLIDGKAVATAGDSAPFPMRAIERCLEAAGLEANDLDRVAFFERPLPKWKRVAATIATAWPFSKQLFYEAAAAWSKGEMQPRNRIAEALAIPPDRVRFCPHDVAHASAAFFPSPFEEAAIVTICGAGESATTTIAAGRGNEIDVLEELRYPHSLSLFAQAFEEFLGLDVGDHRALAAVAAHGDPTYLDEMARFLRLRQDGSFELGLDMFVFRGVSSLSLHPRVESILGPPRDPAQGADQHFANIAASVRAVIEDAILSLADRARESTGLQPLCFGGEMAALVPAKTGASLSGHGAAMGAALWSWHEAERQPRRTPRAGYLN